MIKVFEMFAGYGGASFALKGAGIPHEVIGFSEIDKYSIQCYLQNHSNVKNYGDATKINPSELPDFDLLTGGFPCQAFSVAGKGLGELDTRGTLFNDIIRIAEVKKPRWMLLENVKGLTTKKHKPTFEKILAELDRIGYDVQWKVLNSKEHGTPQNRERVFFVCFDRTGLLPEQRVMQWPKEKPLDKFLKDILEPQVDESYYLSEERTKQLLATVKIRSLRNVLQDKEYSDACCARDYKTPKCVQVNNPIHSNDRVYAQDGVSPTLNTMQGGDRQPFILDDTQGFDGVRSYTETSPALRSERYGLKVSEPSVLDCYNKKIKTDGTSICLTEPHHNSLRLVEPVIVASRGRNPANPFGRITDAPTKQRLEPNLDGVSNAITSVEKDNYVMQNVRIRKLTPTECFRLMGFFQDEIRLNGLSKTQQYKLAGNGWDINLVSQIFKGMFK